VDIFWKFVSFMDRLANCFKLGSLLEKSGPSYKKYFWGAAVAQ
jgi:hypothetical protein